MIAILQGLLDWLQAVLAQATAQGATGEWAVAGVLLAFAGSLWGGFRGLRRLAGSRYMHDHSEAKALRDKVAVREFQLNELESQHKSALEEKERERRRLANLIESEEPLHPDGFLRAEEMEGRDDNFERQVALARRYIARQGPALQRALRLLTDASIHDAGSGDGVIGYAQALNHARAGAGLFATDPDFRADMAELTDLASLHAAGTPARLRPQADRDTNRDIGPEDLVALQQARENARTRGHYRTLLTLTRHGLRITARGTGKGGADWLFWSMCEAEALQLTGQPGVALAQLRPLQDQITKSFGPEGWQTLHARYLIASCLGDTGAAAEALAAAQALLPDQVRVLTADHPNTLATRTLIASLLLEDGQADAARRMHAGVTDGLVAQGLSEEHRNVKRARALDARL